MHIYDNMAKRNRVFNHFHSFVLDDDDNDSGGDDDDDDDAYDVLYRLFGVSILSCRIRL